MQCLVHSKHPVFVVITIIASICWQRRKWSVREGKGADGIQAGKAGSLCFRPLQLPLLWGLKQEAQMGPQPQRPTIPGLEPIPPFLCGAHTMGDDGRSTEKEMGRPWAQPAVGVPRTLIFPNKEHHRTPGWQEKGASTQHQKSTRARGGKERRVPQAHPFNDRGETEAPKRSRICSEPGGSQALRSPYLGASL